MKGGGKQDVKVTHIFFYSHFSFI